MAGRPKAGLDYAGWSVNIFDGDTKIDRLLDAQGWIGFSIYFYLCQMAYKFDGYFYRWSYDDSATTARRMGGGVGSETVRQTVGLCLQIGLFDKRLFDRDGILTSKGIQRRYAAAIQERRRKAVISDYWLLNDEESKGLEKCAKNEDLPPANDHLPVANADLPPADETKVKESKVKQRKDAGTTRKRFVPPTYEEVVGYCKSRNSPVDPRRFWDYFEAGNWVDSKGQPVKNWKQKLITWESRNGGKQDGSVEKPDGGDSGRWNLQCTRLE